MQFHHLIAFNLALLAAIASPGPAFLMAMRTTLNAGRQAGIAVGCGLALMATAWTLMALLGLQAVFTLFPWAYALARIVGAAYLLYIALKMWKQARNRPDAPTRPAGHAFLQGILVNLMNPKSVLFAAAVLIVVFPAEMTAAEKVLVVANHLLVEILFYTALACAMGAPPFRRGYQRIKAHIDRTAAAILGILGLRLLFSR